MLAWGTGYAQRKTNLHDCGCTLYMQSTRTIESCSKKDQFSNESFVIYNRSQHIFYSRSHPLLCSNWRRNVMNMMCRIWVYYRSSSTESLKIEVLCRKSGSSLNTWSHVSMSYFVSHLLPKVHLFRFLVATIESPFVITLCKSWIHKWRPHTLSKYLIFPIKKPPPLPFVDAPALSAVANALRAEDPIQW